MINYQDNFKLSTQFGLDFIILAVAGRMMVSKKCCMLIPQICKYLTQKQGFLRCDSGYRSDLERSSWSFRWAQCNHTNPATMEERAGEIQSGRDSVHMVAFKEGA